MLIPQMKRRSLLTGLASLSATSLFPLKEVAAAVNAAANDIEKITWSAAEAAVRFVSSVKTAKSSVSKRITQEIPAPAPSEKISHKSAPVSEAARFANVSTLPNA